MRPNAKLINFLTNTENVPGVLEVLRNSNAIRQALLHQFWKALRARLEEKEPKEIERMGAVWSEDVAVEHSLDEYVFIDLYLSGSDTHAQGLAFRIEHYCSPRVYELYFGLHWTKRIEADATLLSSAEVRSVEEA
jgi:hypothetical protein